MFNPWHDVPPGNRVPGEFPAIIEIPMRSNVKYELDIVIPDEKLGQLQTVGDIERVVLEQVGHA